MKNLLVLRHAKSSWSDAGLADHDRPLNSRGKKAAPRIGRLIRDEGIVPEVIASSTAKRARKTAELVAEHSGYTGDVELVEQLYHASPETYVDYLSGVPDSVTTALVIGHNPGIQDLVSQLGGSYESFPTATLARLELSIESWREFSLHTPAQLTNLWRPRDLPDEP